MARIIVEPRGPAPARCRGEPSTAGPPRTWRGPPRPAPRARAAGGRVVARLVEVEAYAGPHDRASHAFRGRRTPRNESMYLAGGHAYVYRSTASTSASTWSTGAAGEGIAVLLRAAEIVEGEALVRRRRPGEFPAARLLSGPGNLCRGLAIDMAAGRAPARRGRRSCWRRERRTLQRLVRRRSASRLRLSRGSRSLAAPLRRRRFGRRLLPSRHPQVAEPTERVPTYSTREHDGARESERPRGVRAFGLGPRPEEGACPPLT